ncbi:MAG: hypothetical protein WCD70_08890 [Alphaproteobacteria bacterium]
MSNTVPTENKPSTIRERFICASALLFRGIIAPIDRPFMYAEEAAKKYGYELDVYFSFAEGFVSGAIIATTSVIEAPYQLVRKSPPQSRSWLVRKHGW